MRIIIRAADPERFDMGDTNQQAQDLACLKIFDLSACPTQPMANGRGETIRLINAGLGTEAIDVHLNRLVPGGERGRLHRHSRSDNVYIVRRGEGVLVAGGETYTIRADQVVFIPAGLPHSLSNFSDEVFEMFEIYAPAGQQFDFTPLD
jgi:mannose-6-phosphate isomerase-like protein (cupin superfamily)